MGILTRTTKSIFIDLLISNFYQMTNFSFRAYFGCSCCFFIRGQSGCSSSNFVIVVVALGICNGGDNNGGNCALAAAAEVGGDRAAVEEECGYGGGAAASVKVAYGGAVSAVQPLNSDLFLHDPCFSIF